MPLSLGQLHEFRHQHLREWQDDIVSLGLDDALRLQRRDDLALQHLAAVDLLRAEHVVDPVGGGVAERADACDVLRDLWHQFQVDLAVEVVAGLVVDDGDLPLRVAHDQVDDERVGGVRVGVILQPELLLDSQHLVALRRERLVVEVPLKDHFDVFVPTARVLVALCVLLSEYQVCGPYACPKS